jgi:hypothetical protein
VGFVRQIDIAPLRRRGKSNGLVVNISRSGLEMYHHDRLQEGSELIVRLLFMDEDGVEKPEVISGKVKWVRPLSDQYAAGIEFRDLNERDHFMLLAYIDYAEGFEHKPLTE